ncbi:23S rRNA (guanosine-2'-O-)-methyltransferase RlmB [Candidatus Westeberhardia cardiocondylae]|uniref:23S rRNA (Guanosine-2'-O-)-methyltransferase RlmB n=1 Tax=Candidatus Westeberhardia cardiocondylae TaxID=1594731 RepID=A0A0H5BWT1_9ENTR|nr:23S rRNA (guanosine(2251)-2'-O)-methyltransferase RlmB [Candidatus Westeberhardia cardiocondylae]MCR3756404.1 23S rRNA 2'-O-ribose methyltransferase [Candidatus Westeberhardia cardiocondylae]CEN32138.1 23S rRNA (guanosine-2'-O-)-methyltransferase RlmB [Candidatus Westeberhardia cardiocondylae]
MNEIIYGIHSVESVLKVDPFRFLKVYFIENIYNNRLRILMRILKERGVIVQLVTKKQLNNMVNYGIHQGVVALVKKKIFFEKEIIPVLVKKPVVFFLILDGITDSHNLGSCLRSANAAGVDAVIVPKHRTAKLNSIAKKAASGAAELIPLVRVRNLINTLRMLKKHNIWIIGTSSKIGRSLYKSSVIGSLALIMGSEDKGIRYLTYKYCDEIINIPMIGTISSLNVSVATGICLFEFIKKNQFSIQ